MPRINLLPWREELRKQRQRNFGIAALSAVVLAAGLILAVKSNMTGRIEHQVARNNFLKNEIKILDGQIAEIEDLENVKEQLLARMEIIDQLQKSRPEIVHLFDELVRTVPEGTFLEEVRQAGELVTIKGVAQSSTRVSAFMRNIARSEWLTDPGLNVVETVESDGNRNSSFTIFAKQTRPKREGEDEQE